MSRFQRTPANGRHTSYSRPRSATLYAWRNKYGVLASSEVSRLRKLEAENARRKVMSAVAEGRGRYPEALRTDNGPESVSKALAGWCEAHGVRHMRIQPGRPMEIGRIERFNRTLLEDVLERGRSEATEQ